MKRFFLISTLSLTQIACATVVCGVNEPFKVVSEPSGAVVTTTLETKESKITRAENPEFLGQYYGCSPTPCEFTVPRRSKFVVRIDKEGYVPLQFVVRSKASLNGQTAATITPASVVVGGTITTLAASPGFLGLNAYLVGTSATGASLVAAPMVAVDAASGSMLSLYPNPVMVTLTPLSESKPVDYDLDQLSDGDDTRG